MRTPLFALLAFVASSAAHADNESPSTVENVRASTLSSTAIRVSWNEPWDNVGVVGYNVYRDGSYFSTVHNATNFIDSDAQGQHEYAVSAFDSARNYSLISSSSSGTTGGEASTRTTAAPPPSSNGTPSAPTGLRAEVQSNSQIKLIWNAPAGSVTGYNVYRNDSYLTTVKGRTNYTVSSLNSDQEYRFQVVAFNGSNYSIKSGEIRASTSASAPASASGGSQTTAPTSNTASTSNSSGSVPNGYTLVFSDEFKQRSIDSSKWNTRYRWGPGWTINNEEQYYVDQLNDRNFGFSPFEFDGEHMTINAQRTPGNLRGKANNKAYLSGAMTTFEKFKMRYGYVEMRARLPKGKGLWPAFWLLHAQENGKKPEIDVMEMLGDQPDLVYQTYHYYDNNWNLRSSPSFKAWGPDYSRDFHTYGMKWEPGLITWYVDGVATNSFSDSNVSSEDMYLLLNVAVGGSWPGSPDGSTSFPARFTIDYIRAYRRP